MTNLTFNGNEDIKNTDLSNHEEVKNLIISYSDELNYWKVKHNRLVKRIQDIVCN